MQRRLGKKYKGRVLPCPFKCGLFCRSASGLTQHRHACSLNPANRRASTPLPHPIASLTPPPSATPPRFQSPAPLFFTPRNRRGHNSQPHTPRFGSPHRYQWTVNRRDVRSRIHPLLDGECILVYCDEVTDASFQAGQPCDDAGYDLPEDSSPPPEEQRANDDYFPYSSRPEFELADFLFRKDQMAGKKISELMDILAALQQITGAEPGQGPPFTSAQDLYDKIDSTEIGGVSWQAFSVQFDGDVVEDSEPPRWKTKSYEVWFRDPLKIAEAQIGNKDFGRKMDYGPKRVFSRAGRRQYSDFMSGNWAWNQAVCYIN
jgi:hypothetical protein